MTAPKFAALLQVQDLDTAIDQHVHRLDHLPEAQIVAELDASIAAITARRRELVAVRDEIAGRQKLLEDELAATEGRNKMVSARLYGGEVSASRDLQAMAADIESLKARASSLEDQVLEVLDEREPLDASIAAADEELDALAGRRAAAEIARAQAAVAVQAELDDLRAQRAASGGAVPADLLADYDRLRVRGGGIGAARLVGAQCGGCHLTLPSMELDRVRHAPPDAVMHCEECGRILVRAG